jgi:hypothetical protein
MTLEGGPGVQFVTVEQKLLNGEIVTYYVVHTPIVLSNINKGYSEEKWRALTAHVQAWQAVYPGREVVLREI